MPTLISRILVAFEILLLGIPVMPPFFMIAFASLADTVGPTRSIESFGYLVWSLFIGSFLFAAHRVALAFIHKGPGALRTVHKAWWWLSLGGAAYAVLLTTLLTTQYGLEQNLDLVVEASSLFGLLYLIPLAHVLLEKKLRKVQPHAA